MPLCGAGVEKTRAGATCSIQDISWGTKEGNLQAEKARPRNRAPQGEGLSAARKRRSRAAAAEANAAGRDAEDDETRAAAAAAADAETAQAKEMVEVVAVFVAFRTRVLSAWLLSNLALSSIVLQFDAGVKFFSLTMLFAIAVTGSFRLAGSVFYRLEQWSKVAFWWCCFCRCWKSLKCVAGRCACCFCCHAGIAVDRAERAKAAERAGANQRSSRVAGDFMAEFAPTPAALPVGDVAAVGSGRDSPADAASPRVGPRDRGRNGERADRQQRYAFARTANTVSDARALRIT